VRLPVPGVVSGCIAQAKIGAEIDNAIGDRGELVDPSHRTAVRQSEKQQIALLDRLRSHELQLCSLAEIRMREVHELPIEPLAGDLFHFELRVREGQTKQLASGVPGGANNRDRDHQADAPSASEIDASCG
jgi:hypothetical protein